MTFLRRLLNCFLCLCLLAAPFAHAQRPDKSPIIIRDTEIEATLKSWLEPLLEAAEIGPDTVRIVLVQDPAVNAFVAGGANIFIYTGLIEKTENPGELIGVMAHELGHIAGGHLIALGGAAERASYESILGTAIGIGAAILTGSGAAAQAIISGSQSIAGRRFLTNSRVHESSADQAALKFMETAQINPQGLESFFGKLANQELLAVDQQDEYVRTHPITSNRIETIQTKVRASAAYKQPYPANWTRDHARMKAKLIAFTNPGRVPWVYDERDARFEARYARAIAAYRQNQFENAQALINSLLDEEPGNPYLLELKGQMLLEFGRASEALLPLRRAVEIKPDGGLIRILLGHALMEARGGDEMLREAIEHLERASKDEPRSLRVRRLLATAYGRLGNESRAKAHLAEEATLQGRYDYARELARAVQSAPGADQRSLAIAGDLLSYLDTVKKDVN